MHCLLYQEQQQKLKLVKMVKWLARRVGVDGRICCVLFTYKPLKCLCMYIGFAKLMGFCHVLLLIVHIAI